MNMIIAVAAGGAMGAVGRYFVSGRLMHLLGAGFPVGTLAVNVIGGLLVGVLVEVSALKFNIGGELRAFLMVGLLGGFTTFSSFSLEVVLLLERHQTMAAAGYVLASVVLSVGALFVGMLIMRSVLS
jgi:fluoride exporter